MSEENFDPLDDEKTLNLDLEDSLGDLPTMQANESDLSLMEAFDGGMRSG